MSVGTRPNNRLSRRTAVVAATMIATLAVLVAPLAPRIGVAAESAVLPMGSRLASGQSITSPNGLYTLVLQGDGNLVEYGSRALWASGTRGSGAQYLILQGDGNLVLYTGSGQAVWATYRFATDVRALSVNSDASLQITRATGATLWSAEPRPDILTINDQLVPGQYLTSLDGQYRLILQTDGNVVLYSMTNVAVWDTATFGPMARLTMQADGNLVLYRATGAPAWYSGTYGQPGLTLQVTGQATAQLAHNSAVVWRNPVAQGILWRGQSLAEGQTLSDAAGDFVIMQSDGNFVRYRSTGGAAWSSNTFVPGSHVVMQADGNLVVYSATGKALWSSGTWGGSSTFLALSRIGILHLGDSTRVPTWIEGPPDWAGLARCESGGNPRAVNAAGYYGLYQFDLATWSSNGGVGNPVDASPAQQTAIASVLYLARGRAPWPVCGVNL